MHQKNKLKTQLRSTAGLMVVNWEDGNICEPTFPKAMNTIFPDFLLP